MHLPLYCVGQLWTEVGQGAVNWWWCCTYKAYFAVGLLKGEGLRQCGGFEGRSQVFFSFCIHFFVTNAPGIGYCGCWKCITKLWWVECYSEGWLLSCKWPSLLDKCCTMSIWMIDTFLRSHIYSPGNLILNHSLLWIWRRTKSPCSEFIGSHACLMLLASKIDECHILQPDCCKHHFHLPHKVSCGLLGKWNQLNCSWLQHPRHLLCKNEWSKQQPSMDPLPLRMSQSQMWSLSLSQSRSQRLKVHHTFQQRSLMPWEPAPKRAHLLHNRNEDVL
jgi:hypothetical protein